MKFIDLCKARQSVRKYSDIPVEKDKIYQCIEAARLAPSASNSQPWKFIIVEEPKLKEEVAKATYDKIVTFNKFTHEAPVMVVIAMEPSRMIAKIGSKIKNLNYRLIDIGITSEHFCLQAAELGLGTCMLGWFNPKKIKKILKIPRKIGLVISLGYPAESDTLRAKKRKNTAQICSFNTY